MDRESETVLPGEHGYRFFPAFYHHLLDTMERTRVDSPKPEQPAPIWLAANPVGAMMVQQAVASEGVKPVEASEEVQRVEALVEVLAVRVTNFGWERSECWVRPRSAWAAASSLVLASESSPVQPLERVWVVR